MDMSAHPLAATADGAIDADDDEPVVELVDEAGRSVGTAPKQAAHRPPGRLHRAISVFLLDGEGRLILQRRAAAKYHSGGLWSNSCCGHPAPGEPPELAARRRVAAELGIRLAADELATAGTVVYSVSDPVSGLIEREFNHLFVGRTAAIPVPDPDEVAEVEAVNLADLAARIAGGGFSAWFAIVLDAVRPALGAVDRPDPGPPGP